MPEISSKAGFRQDDDLQRPTRGGEDARDSQADREHTDEPLRADVPGADESVNERSDLAKFLEPSMFPAGKVQLLETAEANFAPDWVRGRLGALPDDSQFETVQEVWEATGG